MKAERRKLNDKVETMNDEVKAACFHFIVHRFRVHRSYFIV